MNRPETGERRLMRDLMELDAQAERRQLWADSPAEAETSKNAITNESTDAKDAKNARRLKNGRLMQLQPVGEMPGAVMADLGRHLMCVFCHRIPWKLVTNGWNRAEIMENRQLLPLGD